jgi:hypothetical protein
VVTYALARDLRTAFKFLYVYYYITELCRRHAKVIQNHKNDHVHIIDYGEVRDRKYKRLTLGDGQAY